ncbi:MAG: oxidoreductase, partial [Actinomycetes bacterium]
MTSSWTAAHIPPQADRTVVVTGANSGLELATWRELARAGARVALAVRDPGRQAAGGRPPRRRGGVRHLDLADLRSVRVFAAEWTG